MAPDPLDRALDVAFNLFAIVLIICATGVVAYGTFLIVRGCL